MPTTQREREKARRRQEKWTQRQAQARARKQRAWAIVGIVVGIALVTAVVVLALNAAGEADTAAEPSPTPATEDRELPPASAAEGREWQTTLSTSAGDIEITLDGAAAPQAVASFVTLGESGYFDGTDCHRLTTAGIFVLQCGDPTGTGTGGPGYTFGPIENAPADGLYPAGTVAMARTADPDSMGSQFFLVYEDTTLPTDTGGYTVFGTITTGLDVVRAVADAGTADGAGDGSPATPVTIEGVESQ
ncbi:peptidylprolyl isomerase [Oerskovia flava]|uniref:peptidylprolyl isomerase n=1 Tax=Oerskovia flava TaxID=2986422 RepID=UPI00223EF183|nr:peptidylprolyl isomerase [Oerskovia sp. JB1-3-2]